MNTSDLDKFKGICNKIRNTIPSSYTASWDEDFHVIRIVFDKSEKDPLLKILNQEFNHQWDFFSIDSASAFIENFINAIFGIIPGQSLFATNESSAPILFAVWWPWGNEDYISLRIGIYSSENDAFPKHKIRNSLLEWINR